MRCYSIWSVQLRSKIKTLSFFSSLFSSLFTKNIWKFPWSAYRVDQSSIKTYNCLNASNKLNVPSVNSCPTLSIGGSFFICKTRYYVTNMKIYQWYVWKWHVVTSYMSTNLCFMYINNVYRLGWPHESWHLFIWKHRLPWLQCEFIVYFYTY